MKNGRIAVDVSRLPNFAFGNRALTWWGVMGFLAIEGTMLVICFVSYFYLRTRVIEWPPPPIELPDLLVPTINLVVMLLSIIPMYLASRAARRLDTRRLLIWTIVCVAFGLIFITLRVFEFYALNVSWDTNAYGSILWTIIVIHTFHIVSEILETFVFTIIVARGHREPKYFVDATDNALYWYFIIGIWVPCYVLIFLAPRFL
jgi:heme/copper-type cytochrome/quinol oxidase subunit 3